MDHFYGFDRLLRCTLHRPNAIRFVGPPGLIDGISAKLHAYLWNLLDESSPDFTILAAEFANDLLGPWIAFRARDAFRSTEADASDLATGLVLAEPDFCIKCVTLDHSTPCLAFRLQERMRVNVWRAGLDQLGLSVGSWLNSAKSAVRRGAPDDTPITTSDERTVALGILKQQAFHIAPGQRLVYITDVAYHQANIERISSIAENADDLYIEAAFLDQDAAIAAERHHLTARQAGELARSAGARRMITFHHSPRYLDRPDSLRLEAEVAYGEGS